MLEQLQNNLNEIFKKLRGQGKITEENISSAMREVRRTLLEADVNYGVARDFISNIKEKALGKKVLTSITPGQQVIKIIHDEMVNLLGNEGEKLDLDGLPPAVILITGLQGSGKTTFAAKLANYLRKNGKKPMLVAGDIYRPAAVDQLKTLGRQLNIPVYYEDNNKNVPTICSNAVAKARQEETNVVILDTAGRLHIDEDMMAEVQKIQEAVRPREVLFVADGMTGQDAVNAAKAFDSALNLSGIVLSKMDGDTRGGAALSIRAVTGKPLKFISTGEKADDLEPFHPERFAGRILGKGDIVSLVEKAQENIDLKDAENLEKKFRKNQFDLLDFQSQLKTLKKMGPLSSIMDMIPGAGKMAQMPVDDNQFIRVEAVLSSMTTKEKKQPTVINASRRKRIAAGSGTQVADVNRVLNQFEQMKKMIKKFNKTKFSRQSLNQMRRGII
ncbi:MAG: signal recognition particle protein [Candidatus Marinimicrobia bacterium]|nr:signal recognition particle protein [Candidatus Neomarinimicrobiota bacterium]